MSLSGETPRENLTLTEADLAACRPIVGEGGHVLRALCPFHGSDRQRSLRVQVHSGRFVCFACGAWGYMETARAQWREEQQRQAALQRPPAHRQRVPPRRQPPPRLPRQPVAAARQRSTDPSTPRAPAPARPDLAQQLAAFQAALPGSRGAAYLQSRSPRRSGMTICLARRATLTPLPCTRAKALSGSVKGLLMRWRFSQQACPGWRRSLACRVGAGIGSETSGSWSSRSTPIRPGSRRAWRCWGLGRHRHLLSLHVQVRIPALEDAGQFPVQRPHSRL